MRTTVISAWALLLTASVAFGGSVSAAVPSTQETLPTTTSKLLPSVDASLESLVAELGGLLPATAMLVIMPCCAGASCLTSSCGQTCCTETQTPYCRCSITGTAECGCTAA